MVDFWTFGGCLCRKVHENQGIIAKVHFGLLLRWSGQALKRPPRHHNGVVFAFYQIAGATKCGVNCRLYASLRLSRLGRSPALRFAFHELVGFRHALVEVASAVHINLGVDRLVKTLHKRVYGGYERDIRCAAVGYQSISG